MKIDRKRDVYTSDAYITRVGGANTRNCDLAVGGANTSDAYITQVGGANTSDAYITRVGGANTRN